MKNQMVNSGASRVIAGGVARQTVTPPAGVSASRLAEPGVTVVTVSRKGVPRGRGARTGSPHNRLQHHQTGPRHPHQLQPPKEARHAD